jgi:hypothetical protein
MFENVSRITLTKEFLLIMNHFSPQTVAVWVDLNSYWLYKKGTNDRINEWVKPHIETICSGTGLSPNTVRKCIKELSITGFISKTEPQYDSDTHMNSANRYYLCDSPENLFDNLEKLAKFRNVKRARDISNENWNNPYKIR